MFRNKRLIFAVLLTGCTTQAHEEFLVNNEVNNFVSEENLSINTELLESVDATLGVADEAIEEILEEKLEARNTISTLQKTVSYEESLLLNLEGSLGAKDSLLVAYETNNALLEKKVEEIEGNLNHALHQCTNECLPTIKKLNKENEELLNYVDSLQNWVFYLDSLVSTNKKLNKKNTFPH